MFVSSIPGTDSCHGPFRGMGSGTLGAAMNSRCCGAGVVPFTRQTSTVRTCPEPSQTGILMQNTLLPAGSPHQIPSCRMLFGNDDASHPTGLDDDRRVNLHEAARVSEVRCLGRNRRRLANQAGERRTICRIVDHVILGEESRLPAAGTLIGKGGATLPGRPCRHDDVRLSTRHLRVGTSGWHAVCTCSARR